MKEFTQFVAGEQEHITKALQSAVEKMPQSVREIADYALLSGGKRLRPILTLLWYGLLKTPQALTHKTLTVYDASIVLEMFHVASLLHDDVLDNADLRRGNPSAHLKFGIRPCLLAGDALLAMGNRQMAEFNNTALMTVISDALLKTAAGEVEEIALAGKIPADSREYLSVIEGKTAWIIRSACEVGAIMAGADENGRCLARDFGLNLGMAFQIVDDALDFSAEEIIGKPAGGDLRERKCTPPVHMYAQSLPAEEKETFVQKFAVLPDPVFEIQKQHAEIGFSDEELKTITKQIIAAGYPQKTRELAGEYLAKAEACLRGFDSPCAAVLREAVAYVQNRNK